MYLCVRCIKFASFYDFPIRFRNCSDSAVLYVFSVISMIFLLDLGTVLTVVLYVFSVISMIFLLDLGTVLTVWYYMFFLLFQDFSIRFRNCSDSVVLYFVTFPIVRYIRYKFIHT
jgi:hypothetical protein